MPDTLRLQYLVALSGLTLRWCCQMRKKRYYSPIDSEDSLAFHLPAMVRAVRKCRRLVNAP